MVFCSLEHGEKPPETRFENSQGTSVATALRGEPHGVVSDPDNTTCALTSTSRSACSGNALPQPAVATVSATAKTAMQARGRRAASFSARLFRAYSAQPLRRDVRMTQALQTEVTPPQDARKLPAVAVLTALGVVYGDIGTSPLYGLKQAIEAGGGPTPEAVMGVVSLIFWALVLIIWSQIRHSDPARRQSRRRRHRGAARASRCKARTAAAARALRCSSLA